MSPASLPSHESEQKTYEFIAAGAVSMIYALSDDCVLKRRPRSNDSFALSAHNIEKSAYKRLGSHPRIARCHAITNDGLVLERGDCLREILRSPHKRVDLHTRLQWALESAKGLRYIPEQNIIHADVGCHNLLIDRSGHVKFIDFAGSGLDGNEALVCYEWCSYRPGSTPDIKTDIFAFGSTLFEIESGNFPFHELQEILEPWELMRRAEQLFAAKIFPDVEMLQLKHVITRCWNGDYTSMAEVVDDTAACCQKATARMASPYTCFHHKEV
ncbi:hypothetical protein HFD88_004677 [Aspergillus terreus]|nr:hypothetical protein HFD88_004677 [Aspergillus terreus]